MRILGYILLLGGFLWLLANIHSFSKDQYAAVDNIINTQMFPFRGGPMPSDAVLHALLDLQKQSKIRYPLILPPACMMLAAGLVLGLQARKRVIVQRIYTSPPSPEIKSRVDDVRHDLAAARQPLKSAGFRRSLLRFMRLTVSRSTYFRTREPDEPSDIRRP